MLDLGCGLAQTIRVVCDPETVGYSYVGADLSFNALRSARRMLRGDFVQCTADRPPFRVASVDAVVMLGTLHHLPDNQRALERVVQLVRPGGFVAFHEVTRRGARNTRRRRVLVGSRSESTHNETIDAEAALAFLSKEAEVLVAKQEYSALRALLVRWLDSSMRRHPALTRLVLWLDSAFLATIGRLVPVLGAHGILVLARKFPRPEMEST
jgi:SAM-dependent methyltransferase